MSKTVKMGRGHLQVKDKDGNWVDVAQVSEFSFTPESAAGRLRYCPLCSCVTNHASGCCEFSEWHEQPRSD